nr:MAG TPA: hypothetical protein [Bacteriophage sp.]
MGSKISSARQLYLYLAIKVTTILFYTKSVSNSTSTDLIVFNVVTKNNCPAILLLNTLY